MGDRERHIKSHQIVNLPSTLLFQITPDNQTLFLLTMHSKASFSVLALTATLLVSFSLGFTLPAAADRSSHSEGSSELNTRQNSCQPPYPEHHGPESCPKADKNPWAGGPTAMKPSFLELSGTSSVHATSTNASSGNLFSRQSNNPVFCRLVASAHFILSGFGAYSTPFAYLVSNQGYIITWCGSSLVSRVRVIRKLPGGGFSMLATVNPNAASGSMSLSLSTDPRMVYFEFVFRSSDAHVGSISLYQVLF